MYFTFCLVLDGRSGIFVDHTCWRHGGLATTMVAAAANCACGDAALRGQHEAWRRKNEQWLRHGRQRYGW